MTEKRFTTDNGSNEDVCLVDNLTKKEYESNFNDIVDVMNKNWEQTQRFEKHNQYLEKENEQLKQQNRELQGELQDKQLGLNLWNAENTILEEEKKQLQKENKELKYKNSQLQETLAFRSNQLALMERLVDDLGSEEMARQMEEILND